MSQEQAHKTPGKDETEEVIDIPTKSAADQEVLDSTDALLDEIDDLLEENSEEFIKAYIQKGGQ